MSFFFAHCHVDFMADQPESQVVQLLQQSQQPLKPVCTRNTDGIFCQKTLEIEDFDVGVYNADEAPFILIAQLIACASAFLVLSTVADGEKKFFTVQG